MDEKDEKIEIEITVERTVCVCKEFKVTSEQLQDLKSGINPFHQEFEEDLLSDEGNYDYFVSDKRGRTIVDWG